MKEDAILFSMDLFDALSTTNDPNLTLFATYFGDLVDNLRRIANSKNVNKIILSISTYEQTYLPLRRYVDKIREVIKNELFFKLDAIFVFNGTAILSEDGRYEGLSKTMVSSKGIRLINYKRDLEYNYNLRWIGIADNIDSLEIRDTLDTSINIPYNIFISDSDFKDEKGIIYSSPKPGIKGIKEGTDRYVYDLDEAKKPKVTGINARDYADDLLKSKEYLSNISELIDKIGVSLALNYEDIVKFYTLKERIHNLLDRYADIHSTRIKEIKNILFHANSQLKHIEVFAETMGYFKIKKQE